MIKEFVENTGQHILIYNSSCFLKYAKQNKELKIRQKSIDRLTKIVEEETKKIAKIRELTQGIDAWRSRMEAIREQYQSFAEMGETIKHLSSIPPITIDNLMYMPSLSTQHSHLVGFGKSQEEEDSIEDTIPLIETEQIENDSSITDL